MSKRVLIVHNEYQFHGGEDSVVAQEIGALERAGCDVRLFTLSNTSIVTPIDRLRAAFQSVNSPKNIGLVLKEVDGFRPDVVHVHNYFPLISPMVHVAVRKTGTPTIQTLHNYRIICANAMLTRNGAPCEVCVGGSAYNAVLHRCYRDSRLGSLAVARSIQHHKQIGTWANHVDRFVALTEFERGRFIAAGLPGGRIAVKANGLADPGPVREGEREGLLFVGRLTSEKGIETLIAAARIAGRRVTVVGTGPLADKVAASPDLDYRGQVTPAQVRAAMREARALLVPSLWYEGLPMVVVEAFALGLPVIASRIGSLAEIVSDDVTGLHAAPGDAADLARAMTRILTDRAASERMSRAARSKYESCWSETVTTNQLMGIYADAMDSHRTMRIAV
ncbi:glycosyltransferase [Methylobacterium sp. Leaf85]|uniref:glycosyltransferase n=1 Tax=Methylobacterium sp. Leaf85 TaxID=1736241 RepID=UPI0006FB156D|nr:glycosyltransferase [Methylobacterium sp. Leaf85]KQO44937.1 glycosyl transferase family 1 [Methylobacterium sp. Leaf85]